MNPISIVVAVLLVAPARKPDEGSLARTLIDQADVARARGDDPSAVSHLRAALQAAQSAESIAEEAAASVRLMEVTRASADLAMAEPLVARALALAPGGTAAEADALRLLGAGSAAAGDRASAVTSLPPAGGVAVLSPDVHSPCTNASTTGATPRSRRCSSRWPPCAPRPVRRTRRSRSCAAPPVSLSTRTPGRW